MRKQKYAIYSNVATNYFEERGFDYRMSVSSVIFWFPDSLIGCLNRRMKSIELYGHYMSVYLAFEHAAWQQIKLSGSALFLFSITRAVVKFSQGQVEHKHLRFHWGIGRLCIHLVSNEKEKIRFSFFSTNAPKTAEVDSGCLRVRGGKYKKRTQTQKSRW